MTKAHFTAVKARGTICLEKNPEEASVTQSTTAPVTEKAAQFASSIMARWLGHGITVFVAAVFLDSLRFKFTNAPKTQVIFGDLDAWSAGFGAKGLFAQTGLFSQYVIGSAELVASAILLLAMFLPRFRFLQPLGALLGIAVMTGAISFHLFTPLGVNVAGDGGSLFFTACGVWVASWVLLFLRRRELTMLVGKFDAFFSPSADK